MFTVPESCPLVSVIIPFFSGIDWLHESIASVLSQTYPNIEIIVIDDGSPEDISSIVLEFGDKCNILRKENGGPASARNAGINVARGKYIALIDSDDLWLPEKLTRQISKMEENSEIWSQHSYELFWENRNKTKLVDTSCFAGNVLLSCYISFKVATDSIVILRDALNKDQIRYPTEKRYGEDIEFYKELAKRYPLSYLDGVYARIRVRGTNASLSAKVQLLNRAAVWETLKSDHATCLRLPMSTCFAYRLCYVLAKPIRRINNDNWAEILARCLYPLPYLLFKLNSLK